MNREAKILVAILLVVVGGMIALFTLSGGSKSNPSLGPAADPNKVVHADSHKTGSGPVSVVEFGDYQCPACGAAYPITKQVMGEYNGKIAFYFRNFPLTQAHPNAQVAAYAAEAAGRQNKFWEMHDKLYDTQNDWAELSNDQAIAKFSEYAGQLGLNLDQFKQDEAGQVVQDIVAADVSDGNAEHIQGTPTIYVGGEQAADYSHDTLKALIDDQLKK